MELDPRAYLRTVSPGFFGAMGAQIVSGRDFTTEDRRDAPGAVIINEALWQGLEPAQRTILTDAARIAEKDLRDRFPALEAEAHQIALDNGMDVIALTEDDLAAWRAATAPLAAAYADAAGPLGAQLLEAARSLRATAGK